MMDLENLEFWVLGAFFGFTMGLLVSNRIEDRLRKKYEKEKENYYF